MKRTWEFAVVRNAGLSETGRFLILNISPLPAKGGQPALSRFGIVTTKRIGNAVVRNLMRRRVRELIRLHGDPLSAGYYVVIVVRKRATMAHYPKLENDFTKLVSRQLSRLHNSDAETTGHPSHPVL